MKPSTITRNGREQKKKTKHTTTLPTVGVGRSKKGKENCMSNVHSNSNFQRAHNTQHTFPCTILLPSDRTEQANARARSLRIRALKFFLFLLPFFVVDADADAPTTVVFGFLPTQASNQSDAAGGRPTNDAQLRT